MIIIAAVKITYVVIIDSDFAIRLHTYVVL